MLEAITYQGMLQNIKNNGISEDTIGILITRPGLEVGRDILKELNYYHHASGKNMNFYLPGYGAYWPEDKYPDKQEIGKIDDTEWLFSDKAFVDFIVELENNSIWEYSGESELLLLGYRNGEITFDDIMQFNLECMIRDKAIDSVSCFFHDLFKVYKNRKTTKKISNAFGSKKLVQCTKDLLLELAPDTLKKIFIQEKYFCVKNCSKK